MRRQAGFTLIEILVVIAIISAMIGGVALMVRQAMLTRMKQAATSRMQSLGAAIELLKSPDNLGFYPSTRLGELIGPGAVPIGKKLGDGNETNVGIETVYVALHLQGIRADVEGFDEADAMGNLDNDNAAEMTGSMKSPALYEYLDPWGNPYVYISNRDYKNMKGVEQYLLGDGTTQVKVAPMKTATGEFARPNSFQLFSFGPDRVPGTEDDIAFGQ